MCGVWCGCTNRPFITHSSLLTLLSSLVSLLSLLFISQSAYTSAYAGAHVRELSLLSSDTQRFKYLITILIKPTANEEEKLRGREEIMLKNRRFGFNKHLVTSNPPLLFSSFLFSSFLSLLSSSCPLLYLFSFSPIFFRFDFPPSSSFLTSYFLLSLYAFFCHCFCICFLLAMAILN